VVQKGSSVCPEILISSSGSARDTNAQRCMRPKRLSLAWRLSPEPARGVKLCRVVSPDRGESNPTQQFIIQIQEGYSRNYLPVVPSKGNIQPLSTPNRDFGDLPAGGGRERRAKRQHAICRCDSVRDREAWVQTQDFLHVIGKNQPPAPWTQKKRAGLPTLITAFKSGILS
jgi:hypothetical protein